MVWLVLVLIALLAFPSFAEDKLIFVQTVWRHGDLTPKKTYPSDPYQRDYWDLPWGEVTQDGLKHMFMQGKNLKKHYIDTGFLNASYDSEQVTFTSAEIRRAVQSGLAMMAGFYSDSKQTPSVHGWPHGWYPVPLHTIPKMQDRILETICIAADEIQKARELTPEFQEYLSRNWNLYALLTQFGGQGPVKKTYRVLKELAREDRNLTLPSWITDEVYEQLMQAYFDGHDFLDGVAGFGVPQDDDLIRLKGGYLLHEWRRNLKHVINGKKGQIKYHGYSAHDHTITYLLHTLGAKQAVMGLDIAKYGATLICELWQRDDEYFVKFLYIDDCTSSVRPITRLLDPCPDDSDFCPFKQFYERTKSMSMKDDEACDVHSPF